MIYNRRKKSTKDLNDRILQRKDQGNSHDELLGETDEGKWHPVSTRLLGPWATRSRYSLRKAPIGRLECSTVQHKAKDSNRDVWFLHEEVTRSQMSPCGSTRNFRRIMTKDGTGWTTNNTPAEAGGYVFNLKNIATLLVSNAFTD